MEKIPCICVMRDLFRSLNALEANLIATYGLTLNEAMVLCSIGNETVSAGTVAECTGLTPSHTSKVISSAEQKGLLTRNLCKQDKRQMHFTLTDKGGKSLQRLKEQGLEMPEILKGLCRTI